jgi:predicted YcjX-like family ATPase
MACRGGFYQQYLRLTNNLYKPAPTQPITQINLILEIDHPKKCKFRFPAQAGRVYYIVGFPHRWLLKPAPTMACRGGFYQQYLRLTNNLYKPAPTQPITQINLILEIDHPKKCKFRFPTQAGRVYYIVGFPHRWLLKPAPTMACRGGFYQQYLRLTNNLYKPAPTQPITLNQNSTDRHQ